MKLGKIYKIEAYNDTNELLTYVGMTTQEYISQRLSAHVSQYNVFTKTGVGSYRTSFDVISCGNYKISLIENVNSDDINIIRQRETFWINELVCVNKLNNLRNKTKKDIESPEIITLTVEEEPDQKNKTFEYYQKYITLYNELDSFRKNNRELIHQGTSVWIQQMRVLNIQFKECYKEYDLKRNYWKPIKSQVIVSMISQMREKRELKWLVKNKEISMEHSFRIWDKRMTYLCVDIRNYHGRPQM